MVVKRWLNTLVTGRWNLLSTYCISGFVWSLSTRFPQRPKRWALLLPLSQMGAPVFTTWCRHCSTSRWGLCSRPFTLGGCLNSASRMWPKWRGWLPVQRRGGGFWLALLSFQTLALERRTHDVRKVRTRRGARLGVPADSPGLRAASSCRQ